MDMNTAGKRGLFSITHTTALHKVHQHLLLLRDKRFMSLEPTYDSRLFQTRLLTAIPSPCNAGGGSAVVVVHAIIHCEVGSQPGS